MTCSKKAGRNNFMSVFFNVSQQGKHVKENETADLRL